MERANCLAGCRYLKPNYVMGGGGGGGSVGAIKSSQVYTSEREEQSRNWRCQIPQKGERNSAANQDRPPHPVHPDGHHCPGRRKEVYSLEKLSQRGSSLEETRHKAEQECGKGLKVVTKSNN